MKQEPDSFVRFLDSYGAANPPRMRYEKGTDFAKWQKRFRAQLHELRGPVPDRVAPEPELLETVQEEGYTRHVLRIPVNAFVTLPAYLLVPNGAKEDGSRPGVLALHGHVPRPFDALDFMCGLQTGQERGQTPHAHALFAVQAGYVVMVPAWWGWTGRDGHQPLLGKSSNRYEVGCDRIQMVASMYGLNVSALHVQDGQAALDALAARPEVDDTRLGCLGNSQGGRMTMWLALHDERIKACVAAGCANLFRERSLKLKCCGIQFPPGILQYGDVPELFSLIAPRPMQLQAGKQDHSVTRSDYDLIADTVRNAYAMLGAEQKLDCQLHAEGHLLLWDLAERFLKKHLGPVRGGA